jgi:hypothetical protein
MSTKVSLPYSYLIEEPIVTSLDCMEELGQFEYLEYVKD